MMAAAPGVPCAAIICHDKRYPELVRLPVLAGARRLCGAPAAPPSAPAAAPDDCGIFEHSLTGRCEHSPGACCSETPSTRSCFLQARASSSTSAPSPGTTICRCPRRGIRRGARRGRPRAATSFPCPSPLSGFRPAVYFSIVCSFDSPHGRTNTRQGCTGVTLAGALGQARLQRELGVYRAQAQARY